MRKGKTSKTKSSMPKTNSSITHASFSTTGGKDVSVRKIANGFIVRESGLVGKGKNAQYKEKEVFSKTNPIDIKKIPLTFGKKK